MNFEAPLSQAAAHPDTSDFQEFWRTARQHLGHIAGLTAVFALIGTLMAYSEPPVFQAQVSMLVEARLDRPVYRVPEPYDPGVGTEEYYTTQARLLKSREILGQVVDRLELTEHDDIIPRVARKPVLQELLDLDWLRWLPFVPELDDDAGPDMDPAKKRELAIDVLFNRVGAVNVFGTQLIAARVDSGSPRLAAEIANVLAEEFVEMGLEARYQSAERTSRWLNERLGDLQKNLEQAELDLQAFRERNKLVNVGGTRSLYEEELLDNSKKLRDAQRRLTELTSTYSKVREAGGDPVKLQEISTLLLDPVVQGATNNLVESEQSIKQLQERYGEKHPRMATAQARLANARRNYHEQLRVAANGVRAAHEIAVETERSLSDIVQQGKNRIQDLDRQNFELRSLEREVQSSRSLYDLFLKRFKETDLSSTFEPVNSRIIDRATVPKSPYKPNIPRVISIWTILGLFLAVCLVALRHLLSEVVRSPDQLEEATGMSVLSVIPRDSEIGRKIQVPTLCLDRPRAPISEGLQSIRASLHLHDVDRRIKRLMFTSALPKEGKSTLTAGFATALGRSERVLLIEADLRAPAQKKIFQIPKKAPGLVEVLTGQATLEQAVFRHEKTGIDVLPVATVPPSPADVVNSTALTKLVDLLASRYDRIVFDTPPCSAGSDSLVLANRVDSVIFVIHAGSTSLRDIKTAIKHLRSVQAPLFGHVLNLLDPRTASGYAGTYYGYGYYRY